MGLTIIGSSVIMVCMYVGEIVTVMLKPMGEVSVKCKTVSFFSESVFNAQRARLRLLHKCFFFVFCVHGSEKTITSVTKYRVQ